MLVESWSLSSVNMQSFWRPLRSCSDWWRLPFFVRIAHSTSEGCWGSLLVPNLMWLTSMMVCRNFWKSERSIYFLSSLISIRAASLNRSRLLILNWRRASSNSVVLAIYLNLAREEMAFSSGMIILIECGICVVLSSNFLMEISLSVSFLNFLIKESESFYCSLWERSELWSVTSPEAKAAFAAVMSKRGDEYERIGTRDIPVK